MAARIPFLTAVPLAALGLMVMGMTLIPLGDAAGKVLTEGLGATSGFVAWSRMTLGALLLAPVLGLAGLGQLAGLLRDWRIWLRGVLMLGTIWAILTAVATEDLATVYGAFFVGPFLSALLAVVFLGEKLGRAQAVCLGLGFVAVLLVVRPAGGITPGIGFALLSGLCYGGYLTASRWLAGRAPPLVLLASQFVLGAVLLAPAGLVAVPEVSGSLAGLMVVSTLCSLGGNLFLILAYRRAPAVVLAPLVYVQLVAATGFGLVFFGHWPDWVVLAGLALLIASGIAGYVFGARRAG